MGSTDRLKVVTPQLVEPSMDSALGGGAAAEPEVAARHRPWGLAHLHVWHGPGLLRRAAHGARRAPLATLLAALLLAGVVGPLLWTRLYATPDLRMVDLAVYRAAGESLVHGRPLYGYLTPVPQLLPFTYPPFSAIVALPLAFMSSQITNWVWTLGTLFVLGWLVMVAFRPFVRRFPTRYRPVALCALLSAVAWTLPVRDCFRFGQVGIFLAALCLLDCVLPKTRWPRGMMIGLAAAVKLVPGVFIPYLWLTNRKRAAVVATLWFVGVSVATAIAMPGASKQYWTSALFDSDRLGNNAGTSNQSIRGAFLRVLPGNLGSGLWVIAVLVVAIAAYRWARSASLSGYEVRGVAIVGLLSVLMSPVSWIHHLAGWIPLAIGVVLGDGRNRRRVLYALAGMVFFSLEVPWWGGSVVGKYAHFHVPGRLLQDAFMFGVLFAVWLLGRMESPSRVRMSATREPAPMSR
ncbi:MAG TPA: glycosyltransferase 87 family protein [Acidothermaceae bacterium]